MRICIYNWYLDTEVKKILENQGYLHNQVVNDDVFILTKHFFDLGLNCMLIHCKNDTSVILALSKNSFGQR